MAQPILDAVSSATTGSGIIYPLIWSHTVSGSTGVNTVLIVFTINSNGTGNTSVSYAGIPMRELLTTTINPIGNSQRGLPQNCECDTFYLLSPPTNVSYPIGMSGNGGGQACGVGVSFTNANAVYSPSTYLVNTQANGPIITTSSSSAGLGAYNTQSILLESCMYVSSGTPGSGYGVANQVALRTVLTSGQPQNQTKFVSPQLMVGYNTTPAPNTPAGWSIPVTWISGASCTNLVINNNGTSTNSLSLGGLGT